VSPPSTLLGSGLDARIAAVVARGGGIATFTDLVDAGVARRAIRRRIADGRLVEVVHDVVAYPQDELLPLTWRRAVLASCGGDAALAHWTAAEHLALITFQRPEDPRPHVVVPRPRNPQRDDIVVHRSGTVGPQDLIVHDGLACLALPRLLRDLASKYDARFVQRLIDEAAYLGLYRAWEIEALLDRSVGHPGTAVLRAALAGHRPGTTRTTNDLEEAFLRLSDAQGWPRPVCQSPQKLPGGKTIHHDFLWKELGVAAETDGGRGHSGEHRRRRDRWRDAQLAALGVEVVRARWDEVFHDRVTVITRVEPVLRRHGWDGRRKRFGL